jgi:Fic family protein
MTYTVPTLPLKNVTETPRILKKAIAANKVIAELKEVAHTIPNQAILINTLALQESKDSSEIENIVTTHDELFKYDKKSEMFSPATKEVYRYADALFHGCKTIETKPITNNLLIEIARVITGHVSGFRNVPGTVLKDGRGEVVYTPPQNVTDIANQMKNLEQFINDQNMSDFDPLVKMAIIHHQFESIHPFFDGNGRTGRILNILYLIAGGTLDNPILYLSRYITKNKAEYYRLLQKVREEEAWEEWILYMLTALESTARQTISTIESIKFLMAEYKTILREKEPKIYSHELMNTIFSHPYTKIEFLTTKLHVSRLTASKYLRKLASLGLLKLEKHKNTNYYINTKLVTLITSL